VVDVFVDELDLGALGFEGVDPAATGRPAYHPAILLKIYIYGYLNRIQSSRRLEREYFDAESAAISAIQKRSQRVEHSLRAGLHLPQEGLSKHRVVPIDSGLRTPSTVAHTVSVSRSELLESTGFTTATCGECST
jgi:hypothetical protein